jgi:hypothetical protein
MDHGAAARVTDPLAERFQHRVVRFLPSETLDTLPADDSQIRAAGRYLLKCINEGRLSDARLSSDEDDLPLRFQGLAEVAVQLLQCLLHSQRLRIDIPSEGTFQ